MYHACATTAAQGLCCPHHSQLLTGTSTLLGRLHHSVVQDTSHMTSQVELHAGCGWTDWVVQALCYIPLDTPQLKAGCRGGHLSLASKP